MKKHKLIKISTCWSTISLTKKVEQILDERVAAGYQIVTVSFGVDVWWRPTAYITLCKEF
jgi:hypothetical protein